MVNKKLKYGQFLVLLFAGLISYSQPNWNYTITSANHTILIQNTIEISIDGVQITAGDYIGVFYDSLGTSACGGYVVWQGNSTTIAAWGSQPGLNDGFAQDEEFQWRIWSAAGQQEYTAIASYNSTMFPNQGNFADNGMSGLSSLIAVSTVEPHPQWNFSVSSDFHRIIIPDSIAISINNSAITNGDYIGVFFDSSGVVSCGGYIKWTNTTDTLIAYGDTAGLTGFSINEVFTWKIWRAADQIEAFADVVYDAVNFPDSSFYASNGLSALLQLSATTGPDIGVLEIVSPQTSCDLLSSTEAVDVLFVNSGDELISNFNVQISINNWDTIVNITSVNIQSHIPLPHPSNPHVKEVSQIFDVLFQ